MLLDPDGDGALTYDELVSSVRAAKEQGVGLVVGGGAGSMLDAALRVSDERIARLDASCSELERSQAASVEAAARGCLETSLLARALHQSEAMAATAANITAWSSCQLVPSCRTASGLPAATRTAFSSLNIR